MFDTPILLITFNRPKHLRKVLEVIRVRKPKELYIFQDGPREDNSTDQELVLAVRTVVDEIIDWPCNVHKRYSECNLGCGPGPVDGITWFFQNVEYGIIIEDDAIPHIDFFEYASTLLQKYQSDSSIRVIGSMKIFEQTYGDGSYYFSMMNRTLCAWASWRRAWALYNYTMTRYSTKDLKRAMREYGATIQEIEYWQDRLEEVHVDCLGNSSWDQQFWMTIWLTGGKGICPNRNLSTNIGFDETATHIQDGSNIASCRALEPILPLIHPTSNKIQRKADEMFHKLYFGSPRDYGWRGFRIRLNKKLKKLLHHSGPWLKNSQLNMK